MAKLSRFDLTVEEAESVGVITAKDIPLLINRATPHARVPIFRFKVGVVGRGSSGRVFLGVNVEFSGVPLHHSIHAEQFLVTNLALNSEPGLTHLAVSARYPVCGPPCGHCRQFLQEIRNNAQIQIWITDKTGHTGSFISLESLLPDSFGPHRLLSDKVPLLLEQQLNSLTLSDSDAHSDRFPNLMPVGLAAANKSFAPYSECPSGVALVDSDGEVYRGWYIESVAFNPSLGPVQAAVVDFVARGGGKGFEEIVGAVLVEKKDAKVSQEDTARMLLKKIAPECHFQVFHCS